MVIPGQCFIYDHTKIFHVVLLCEYVAVKSVLSVFAVTGSGYVEDATFHPLSIAEFESGKITASVNKNGFFIYVYKKLMYNICVI